MTDNNSNGTIRASTTNSMAQRPRISIDVSPQFYTYFQVMLGEASVKAEKRVSPRELLLAGLLAQFPQYKSMIEKEMGDPAALTLLERLLRSANKTKP